MIPDFGIYGSQMINLYPFDSDAFYSATQLLLDNMMLAPLKLGANVYSYDPVDGDSELATAYTICGLNYCIN